MDSSVFQEERVLVRLGFVEWFVGSFATIVLVVLVVFISLNAAILGQHLRRRTHRRLWGGDASVLGVRQDQAEE